jgi:SAM-dependent methyltransferase
MNQAAYRNHQHYIAEGWSREPKETFKALEAILRRKGRLSNLNVLDVGCATGELLGFLASRMERSHFTGVDVTEDLLGEGRRLAPFAEFRNASALDLPADFTGQFDLVCAIGCMSIFDEREVERFWDNLLRVGKRDGLVVALSPLNEHGVDVVIRHRKRLDDQLGNWETGWNVFSTATVQELIAARGATLELEPFELPFDIARKADPVRTWTISTDSQARQLTNGLKLLIDHYFMIVEP